MNGIPYLQIQKNSSYLRTKTISGLFPFSAATLLRNQRVFMKGALLYKLRPLFFIVIVIFSSCSDKDKSLKYKPGGIVYLKPDSTKAVIQEVDPGCVGDDYMVIKGHESGFGVSNIEYIKEEMIY